jgi:hypothetical protein
MPPARDWRSREAAGFEPASRRKHNPKQVALSPANVLISHRIVPPLRPVSSRSIPRWRVTLGAHAAQQGQSAHGRERPAFPGFTWLTRGPWEADERNCVACPPTGRTARAAPVSGPPRPCAPTRHPSTALPSFLCSPHSKTE